MSLIISSKSIEFSVDICQIKTPVSASIAVISPKELLKNTLLSLKQLYYLNGDYKKSEEMKKLIAELE